MKNENKIPEPVKLNTFIINRNKEKFCGCYSWFNRIKKGVRPQFTLDTKNRVVTCHHCGVFVDPFDALLTLAEYDEEREEELKKLYEVAREVMNYKPWKKALKRIEKNIGRSGENIPVCPRCKFDRETDCKKDREYVCTEKIFDFLQTHELVRDDKTPWVWKCIERKKGDFYK